MLIGFDHTMLVTGDLAKAVADFTAAGFTVVKRDDAGKGPSENRLVVFADGSYLELLHLVDPDYAKRHRLSPLAALGDGWGDYSIHTDAIEADRKRIAAAGLPVVNPPDYTKTLADGRAWGVRLANLGRGIGRPELPFLVEDTGERGLRVPSGGTRHANGALGTMGMRLVTGDLDGVAAQMDTVFGVAGKAIAVAHASAARRWTFGTRFVEIFVPAAKDTPAGKHLATRGASLYEAVLLSDGRKSTLTCDGARMTLG